MKVCPQCGFKDDPMWKPLAWRIYWEYASQEDFKEGYPHLAPLMTKPKIKNEEGNFYYNFDDAHYYYQVTTKKSKRQLVRRFPKGYESMANRELFEVTPTEKGYPNGDIFQKKLISNK